MFRRVCTLAVAALAAFGSFAMSGCGKQPSSAKPAAGTQQSGGGKTEEPPKELTLDLDHGVKLEMILIPAGEFMMGSPDSEAWAFDDQKPRHRVRITRPFYIGKHKVTQEQWKAVMGNDPSCFKGPQNPVESVSWDDCQQFLDKLNARSQPGAGKFQLPTEAQWEYACRAGARPVLFWRP